MRHHASRILRSQCFIQNYVDADTSSAWKDYTCGSLSYDGHKGTDFRLKNEGEMRAGVNVLAVADGTVLNVRDEMPDKNFRDLPPQAIANKECGNGVVIDHVGGYRSQYCHMKLGSIVVKPQQEVKRGEVLGQIGLSGMTEFPHLHLQISKDDGTIIDPFTGLSLEQGECGEMGERNYWRADVRKELSYVPTGVLGYGWSDAPLQADKVRAGDGSSPETLPVNASAIVFWLDLFGLQQDDQLAMAIVDPNGKTLVNHAQKIDSNKAQFFQFVGKRLSEPAWVNGYYKAIYTVSRGTTTLREPIVQNEVQILVGQEPLDMGPDKPEKAMRILKIE